jgi:succinyldiaminopimelate transaminase
MPVWGRELPDFPWDLLAPYAEKARQHSDGIIDLSVGTPVDPTPHIIQTALAAAADSSGYPTTIGTVEFRQSAIDWLQTHHDVVGLSLTQVLPSIGSKEIVAWLPTHLGLGPADAIALPRTAYPTYEIGARLAGCSSLLADSIEELEAAFNAAEASGRKLRMAWLNSPSNPTGAVTSISELTEIVQWARKRNVLIVSDECYIDLGWDAKPVSVLNQTVCGGDFAGVIAVHSLSKRSNLAGYRAGFIAGDEGVIKAVLEVRKHSGMILSSPVQHAAAVAFSDVQHVAKQRERYQNRREIVMAALKDAGFTIEHSNAGLYVWCTRAESDWKTVDWFAERGVLVAPGSFYGEAGGEHVRVALTATDERIGQLASRLRLS